MDYSRNPAETRNANHLRMRTLIRLRTLAVIGQSVTVLGVAYGLGFPLPVASCFLLIACLLLLNIALQLKFPATYRLDPSTSTFVLSLDILQLFGLLFITGGLANPFAVLLCVPVIVASASLPVRNIIALGLTAVAGVTVLAVYHRPLPWYPGTIFRLLTAWPQRRRTNWAHHWPPSRWWRGKWSTPWPVTSGSRKMCNCCAHKVNAAGKSCEG